METIELERQKEKERNEAILNKQFNYIKQRNKDANDFVEGKTDDELRDYLARSTVAYYDWKDADSDALKQLAIKQYLYHAWI